jgi:hypothetical protein
MAVYTMVDWKTQITYLKIKVETLRLNKLINYNNQKRVFLEKLLNSVKILTTG